MGLSSRCKADGMADQSQYDEISDAYGRIADRDPSKYCIQFPWARRQLPTDIAGLRILDVGCGEGELTRSLAREGASVVGYDESANLIDRAKSIVVEPAINVQYHVATAANICEKLPEGSFDFAVSTCVLHYAPDLDGLIQFFKSTAHLLKPGGLFAGLVSNAEYGRFGQMRYNRRYVKEAEGRLRVEFIDEDKVVCSATYSDFSKSDYERTAGDRDWHPLEWRPVLVNEGGVTTPAGFWEGFEQDCPYVGFVATRV